MVESESSFFATNSFWAMVALILFFAVLIYYKVPSLLKAALHKRAVRIAHELEEARRLRDEAQQLLAEYQKKRFAAEQEAAEIIASAERQAENIVADMRQKTEAYIAGRHKMAEQRIALAESEAVRSIRSAAVDKAVLAAGQAMENRIKADAAEGERLFRNSVADVEAGLKKTL